MLGKVSLYKGKRLFAADGKAGVLAFKADIQVPCPLGVVAAAAQADSNDGVLLAVYADLFVCDTNAEGVASRTIREVGIRLEVLKTDLREEILEVCRAFPVSLGVGDVSGSKAHRHCRGGKVLPVQIRGVGKIPVAVGKRTRVIRLHVVMPGIEHDGACDGIVAVIRRERRHGHYRDEQHEYQHDAECSFHFSSSILYFFFLFFYNCKHKRYKSCFWKRAEYAGVCHAHHADAHVGERKDDDALAFSPYPQHFEP